MPDVTLEALAARVDALERRVDALTNPPSLPGYRPPTGDWEAFERAMAALRDGGYDFDAASGLATVPGYRPPTGDWDGFRSAMSKLADALDLDVFDAQDAAALRHANDHLP